MEVICTGDKKFDKIYDWTDINKLKKEEKEEEPIIEKNGCTCCKM